jgi:hypothetical protein
MSKRAARYGLPRAFRWLIALALIGWLGWVGWTWIANHPEHNPLAPLALTDPIGMATRGKIAEFADDGSACRAALTDGAVDFSTLPSVGSGQCIAADRTRLAEDSVPGLTLRPAGVAPSCAVSVALLLWMRERVQPAAQQHFGQPVERLEHLGSYNCRSIGGGTGGTPSEHSTGNAIDIAAFVLADGTRISLIDDWRTEPDGPRSGFLRDVRDGACDLFGTTLSPDYNAAHADHFHFDKAQRASGWTACR